MPNELQFVLYHIDQEDVKVKVAIKDETIWLTQRGMAELFDCSADNISLHLKNIYQEGELQENATAEDFSVVQTEGTRNVLRTIIHLLKYRVMLNRLSVNISFDKQQKSLRFRKLLI